MAAVDSGVFERRHPIRVLTSGGGSSDSRPWAAVEDTAFTSTVSRPAISQDAWEFRKLCQEGSILPGAMAAWDVDGDGADEIIFGTTEGHVVVLKPGQRQPLFFRMLTATVSVVLYSVQRSKLVLVTLEGQCEVVENFLVPPDSRAGARGIGGTGSGHGDDDHGPRSTVAGGTHAGLVAAAGVCIGRTAARAPSGATHPAGGGVLHPAASASDVNLSGDMQYPRLAYAASASTLGNSESRMGTGGANRSRAARGAYRRDDVSAPLSSAEALRHTLGSGDGTHFSSIPAGCATQVFMVPANCTCGDIAADNHGDRLFLGSSDRRVYVYCLSSRQCIASIFMQARVTSIKCFCYPQALHPDSIHPHAPQNARVAPTRPGTRSPELAVAGEGKPEVDVSVPLLPSPMLLVATVSHLALLSASHDEIALWGTESAAPLRSNGGLPPDACGPFASGASCDAETVRASLDPARGEAHSPPPSVYASHVLARHERHSSVPRFNANFPALEKDSSFEGAAGTTASSSPLTPPPPSKAPHSPQSLDLFRYSDHPGQDRAPIAVQCAAGDLFSCANSPRGAHATAQLQMQPSGLVRASVTVVWSVELDAYREFSFNRSRCRVCRASIGGRTRGTSGYDEEPLLPARQLAESERDDGIPCPCSVLARSNQAGGPHGTSATPWGRGGPPYGESRTLPGLTGSVCDLKVHGPVASGREGNCAGSESTMLPNPQKLQQQHMVRFANFQSFRGRGIDSTKSHTSSSAAGAAQTVPTPHGLSMRQDDVYARGGSDTASPVAENTSFRYYHARQLQSLSSLPHLLSRPSESCSIPAPRPQARLPAFVDVAVAGHEAYFTFVTEDGLSALFQIRVNPTVKGAREALVDASAASYRVIRGFSLDEPVRVRAYLAGNANRRSPTGPPSTAPHYPAPSLGSKPTCNPAPQQGAIASRLSQLYRGTGSIQPPMQRGGSGKACGNSSLPPHAPRPSKCASDAGVGETASGKTDAPPSTTDYDGCAPPSVDPDLPTELGVQATVRCLWSIKGSSPCAFVQQVRVLYLPRIDNAYVVIVAADGNCWIVDREMQRVACMTVPDACTFTVMGVEPTTSLGTYRKNIGGGVPSVSSATAADGHTRGMGLDTSVNESGCQEVWAQRSNTTPMATAVTEAGPVSCGRVHMGLAEPEDVMLVFATPNEVSTYTVHDPLPGLHDCRTPKSSPWLFPASPAAPTDVARCSSGHCHGDDPLSTEDTLMLRLANSVWGDQLGAKQLPTRELIFMARQLCAVGYSKQEWELLARLAAADL